MAVESLNVVVPDQVGPEARHSYVLETLRLVLDKSGHPYVLSQSQNEMTQLRFVKDLEKNNEITVIWAGTSPELEEILIPIRIPVYRGLLGYRLFLIHQDNQEDFSNVKNLRDLRQYRAGQGIGWSDVEILANAGLMVNEATYEDTLSLLTHKRIDYFPRGVNEAFPEHKAVELKHPDITVETSLMLHYPFAMYFFVNQGNPRMAKAIEEGFLKAYEDGSFQDLFNSHPDIQDVFRRGRLQERTIIEIDNPRMSEETRNLPELFLYSFDN